MPAVGGTGRFNMTFFDKIMSDCGYNNLLFSRAVTAKARYFAAVRACGIRRFVLAQTIYPLMPVGTIGYPNMVYSVFFCIFPCRRLRIAVDFYCFRKPPIADIHLIIFNYNISDDILITKSGFNIYVAVGSIFGSFRNKNVFQARFPECRLVNSL